MKRSIRKMTGSFVIKLQYEEELQGEEELQEDGKELK